MSVSPQGSPSVGSTALLAETSTDVAGLLHADAPHPDHAADLALFGQFIGSWELAVRFFDADGQAMPLAPARWTFGWALDGRAIQDVIVMAGPDGTVAPGRRRIGTTVRYFDRQLGAWRIVFVGATTGVFVVLTGDAMGDEIHLDGPDIDGGPMRWRFSEIGPNRFHWMGWKSSDGGETWWLEQEMEARRIGHTSRTRQSRDR